MNLSTIVLFLIGATLPGLIVVRAARTQDKITQQAGHADKLLPDEQRRQVQRIISQPESDTEI